MTAHSDDEKLERVRRQLEWMIHAGEFKRLTRQVLASTPDEELDHTLLQFVEDAKINSSGMRMLDLERSRGRALSSSGNGSWSN